MANWTWIITAGSIIGTIANIYKKPWAFAVWLVTNVTWCVYNAAKGEYSQSVLWGVYACLSIWGLIAWTRNKEQNT